ncbi:MAG: hypothetical protein ABSA97_06390 [Verrucomicrobiia bacterium]
MATPRQMMIDPTTSLDDSMPSAINAYEWPRMPAVSFAHARTALVASPSRDVETLR